MSVKSMASGLKEATVTMDQGIDPYTSPMYNRGAREHEPHKNSSNTQKEHLTTFPGAGKTGARGQSE